MRLPMKGSHTMKMDNPLIIMTSNKSMAEHCQGKWYRDESEAVLFTKTFKARVHDLQLFAPLFTDFAMFRKIMFDCTVFHPVVKKEIPMPF